MTTTDSAIPRPLARHVIEVLGSFGTPPARGIQHFNVGNHSLLNALDDFYLSSYLQDGGAAYKMVIGDYGSGKSHFLYCLRDIAWERNFAVVKVDLSPVETPYNDQKKVYEAVANNILWHEPAEGVSDDTGLTRFLEGTLERVIGGPLSLETLTNPLYRGLVDTLEATPVDSPAYQTAVVAYFDSLVRDQEERLDALARWLLGEPTTPADTKILREVGVTGKINRPNAFRMLRSLCQVIRALSYSGLILLFDEVDRMASVGGKAEKLATDTLREVIDRTREDLPGAMFVYAVPPQFINDIVPKYPALQQRVRAPGHFSRVNHFSPMISLDHLDLDEDDLMLAIGEKLIPIYETAFETQLDHAVQRANAAILANVARDIFLDISHRRLFVKSFVVELSRQHHGQEHTITEEEAQAILRGQVEELTGGETPPY
ncbi:MAG: ATP-binding protein [Chloroflexi bacterium]|nr:ATP-binding protein [Chloroflexota bacterium]MCI0579936.1 ATP-binding protein [Chloroflexota bacterium]MCI0646519.1 ATP-binding protein [Chloroflexota bacterium]MCI0726129.1 ATP-binding protein [Chloroflexota bacterium]